MLMLSSPKTRHCRKSLVNNRLRVLKQIRHAVRSLKQGGVIAYPTESCFGLGCDPQNPIAIRRILKLKNRRPQQGVILIASDVRQLSTYVDLDASPLLEEILNSWPGPFTWILPAKNGVSRWVKGQHETVAVRVTDHPVAKQICKLYGKPIVSTSANRHGKPALVNAKKVLTELGMSLDFIVNASVGDLPSATQIQHGMSGKIIRT